MQADKAITHPFPEITIKLRGSASKYKIVNSY